MKSVLGGNIGFLLVLLVLLLVEGVLWVGSRNHGTNLYKISKNPSVESLLNNLIEKKSSQ